MCKRFWLDEKVALSVRALRLSADMSRRHYGKKLVLTYSGGKDSDVMLHLAENCLGADEFEVVNSHTSVDAPQTVRHIRKQKERLADKGIEMTIHIPMDENGRQINMVSLILKNKYPPTRIQRYCCRVLKETTVSNRLCSLGVRGAESTGRRGRDTFATRGVLGGGIKTGGGKFFSLDHAEKAHSGYLNDPGSAWKDDVLIATMLEHGDIIVNPIYYWTDDEVWQYIREQRLEVNPLYYAPYYYERVGCVLCPMSGYREKKRQEQDFPGYKRLYIHAFDRMLQARKESGLDNRSGWETGEDVYKWWTEEYKHSVKGQISIDDWLKSLGGDDGNS